MKLRYVSTAINLLVILIMGAATQSLAGDSPERLYLQQVSTHSTIVKWRGGDADQVCFSRKLKNLKKKNWPRCVAGVETAGGHMEAQLTGLAPDKTYYYSVGGMTGSDQVFRTAPNSNKPPADGNTHILIVGDSGTQTEKNGDELEHDGEAAEVLAGFETYNANNGGEPVDVFLALGDNAYVAGTDVQWQGAFFDIYPQILKSASVLTTIGNHEMGYGPIAYCLLDPRVPCPPDGPIIPLAGLSSAADPAAYDGNADLIPDGTGIPYLDIFSLPSAGESGGVPSGTEQYYAVDYGNVHIVSLDSQLTARDTTAREAMRQWLIADLSSNNRDWTIVIFHHPPYSKGSNHDSDDVENSLFDIPMWDMRNEFTPVFEEYGVDVVYSGHAHSYERSYYLRGHTGVSNTFVAADHAELNGAGVPALGYGDDTYAQLSPTSGGVDDRVVYTVAGSSGKADDHGGFNVTEEELLRHPAHILQPEDPHCDVTFHEGDHLDADGNQVVGCRNGLALKGSVVVDAGKKTLTAKFVDVDGNVLDQFTITR